MSSKNLHTHTASFCWRLSREHLLKELVLNPPSSFQGPDFPRDISKADRTDKKWAATAHFLELSKALHGTRGAPKAVADASKWLPAYADDMSLCSLFHEADALVQVGRGPQFVSLGHGFYLPAWYVISCLIAITKDDQSLLSTVFMMTNPVTIKGPKKPAVSDDETTEIISVDTVSVCSDIEDSDEGVLDDTHDDQMLQLADRLKNAEW